MNMSTGLYKSIVAFEVSFLASISKCNRQRLLMMPTAKPYCCYEANVLQHTQHCPDITLET